MKLKMLKKESGKNQLGALYDGAKFLKLQVKKNAPVVTGNIKRSIVAKKFKKQGLYEPGAFVAIDRKIAPHAHLLEYGTEARYDAAGAYRGQMPAKPFFRPAIDSNMHLAARIVALSLEKRTNRTLQKMVLA